MKKNALSHSPTVRRRTWSASFSALLMAAGVANFAPGQDALPPPPPKPTALRDLPLDFALFKAEEALKADPTLLNQPQAFAQHGIRVRDDGRVHVEIVGPTGSRALTPDELAPFEGEIENTWRHRTEAWLPVNQLSAAARAIPAGYRIAAGRVTLPTETGGEGATEINSISYTNGDADGVGRVIAVIDNGFQNLSAAIANGDAPVSYTQINFTGSAFQGTTQHGTGCVEAAFDHCPGATWRLYKIDDDSLTDYGAAVDDAVAHGADIITASLAAFNTGWADNSGDACAAVNDAASSGVLVFVPTGNYAQEHWQGTYADANGNQWLDFAPGDEMISVSVASGSRLDIFLSWNENDINDDYDLSLYNAAGDEIASSSNWFNIFESINWTNTGGTQTVRIAVYRDSGNASQLELLAMGDGVTWLEHIVESGSATCPANSTHAFVIANGAVGWSNFASPNGASGIVASYSGRGPSNSGMTLPDLSGPTNTGTTAYGGAMGGTSNATPNNAGAACALWSADALLDPNAIRWLLFEQAKLWRDWGAAGLDNIYGYGGTILHEFAPNTIWVARGFGNTSGARNAPYYYVAGAQSAAVAGGRLAIFAGNYPEPVTLDKGLRIEAVGGTVILGQ